MHSVVVERPSLFKAQQLVYDALDKYRFILLCCGRRWGKDFLITRMIIDKLLEKRNFIALYSPEITMTEQIFDMVHSALVNLVSKKNSSKMELKLINGSVLRGWHLQHINQGRGKKNHYVFINEAAFAKSDFKEKIYYDVIRPTISTKGEEGKILFSSTPFGENFFFEFLELAKADTSGLWAWFHYPSSNSPYMSQAEIEEAKKELPPTIFRRNYEAVFEGSNERQLVERSDLINNFISKPAPELKGEICLGADFCGDGLDKETEDFNTLAIRDGMQIVYYEKNKMLQVDFQKHILLKALEYNASTIVCDHIGVGSGTVVGIRRLIEGYNQKAIEDGKELECNIVVRAFNNLIQRRRKEKNRKRERTTLIEDIDVYFNNYSRIAYLLRLALRENAFKIIRNAKLENELISQFTKMEFEYAVKGQESTIRVHKKGVKDNEKSPDIPDAIIYTLTSKAFAHLVSRAVA